MADNIVDNRALISNADSVPGSAPYWVDIGAAAMGTGNLDGEIFLEGTGSIGEVAGSTRAGIFYEYAATQDLSSNHIYMWVLCGVVGLLETKAAQGLTFRIYTTDPTTDYAEWDLAGSDSWPNAIQGGWTLFCVDLESTPSRTSGTAPSTAAVLGLGISFQTPSMPRMVNNTWMDAMYSLADGVPAVIVEGKNGGTTPWTWADLPAELGTASGAAQLGPGGSIILNGPVEFFADDAADHEFDSTNELVLWAEHEFAASDLYGITVLGAASGTADFKMGIKTGAGDDATGAQGGSIQAASTSVRWFWDSNAANIDSVNMYGVQLSHCSDLVMNTATNSWIGVSYLDCSSADIRLSEQLRCKVIDPDVLGGVAFFVADEMDNIVFCEFASNGVGHAIELQTPIDASQISKGNLFSGYDVADPGTANNKAIFNDQAGAVIISNTNGGNLTEDYHVRNGTSATTDVQANISTTLTGMKDNTEVRVYDQSNPPVELAGIENATAGTTDDRSFAFALSATTVVDIVIFNVEYILPPNNRIEDFTVPSVDSSLPISQVFDRNFENP